MTTIRNIFRPEVPGIVFVMKAILFAMSVSSNAVADSGRIAALEQRVHTLEQWADSSETVLTIARSRWYGAFYGWAAGLPISVVVGDDGITYQGGGMRIAKTYPFKFADGRIAFNVAQWRIWLEHAQGGMFTSGDSRLKMRYRYGNAGPVYNTRLYRDKESMPPASQPLHNYQPLGVGISLRTEKGDLSDEHGLNSP